MRYYRLEVTDKNDKPIFIEGTHPFILDSSDNPRGALHIEFDIPALGADTAVTGSSVVIYGLPLTIISQQVNFFGGSLKLYAGFQSGLPLAKPQQAGLIAAGQINNPYGNWIGTHQTLNLGFNPVGKKDKDGKTNYLTLDGKKGEKLADALKRCLKNTFPQKTININIYHDLVLVDDFKGHYLSITQLASDVKGITPGLLRQTGYTGVQIVLQNNQINVFDSSKASAGIKIAIDEFIGQPTWVNFGQVSFKTPMRADLQVGDRVTFPIASDSAFMVSTPQARLQWHKLNFSGTFQITSMRHIGQYSHADGEAWVTIFEAATEVPK